MEARIEKAHLMGKLTAARTSLLLQMPFYGTLLMHLKFGLADCGTACTDMRRILWDPEFLNRLDTDEICFVMLHEVMHCVLNHVERGKGKIHLLYNIAADIVVNSNLLEVYQKEDFCVDGEAAMHLAPDGMEGRKYTADRVYEMLMQRYEDQMNDAGALLARIVEDYGDILDNHDIWEAIQVTSELKDTWKLIVMESVGGNDAGFGHCEGIRMLLDSEDYKPVINWRQVLNDFIQIVADTYDFTFAPADRRFSDGEFILPAFNEQDGEMIENVWMVIDASGSINTETLTSVFAEVKYSISQFSAMRGKISSFDTAVTDPVEFESVDDLSKIRITGGGGTSFCCIFEYLEQHLSDDPPVAIVILTDGYAPWPDEWMARGIPVLWMLIDNEKDAPWGKSIHIHL